MGDKNLPNWRRVFVCVYVIHAAQKHLPLCQIVMSLFPKEILIHKPQYAVIDPKRGDLGMGRLKAV